MKIIAWQYCAEDRIYKFIYEKPSGYLGVVLCENYGGLTDFINHSGATMLDKKVDIWSYLKDLEASA
jgi:hypothetical protein